MTFLSIIATIIICLMCYAICVVAHESDNIIEQERKKKRNGKKL